MGSPATSGSFLPILIYGSGDKLGLFPAATIFIESQCLAGMKHLSID
jgi:hypothetical protein